jgi:hypothetical protein
MDRLRQDGSAPAGVEAERQRLARLHLARLNDLLEAALRIRLSLARVAQAEAAGYHADGRSSAPDLAGRTACLVG